MEKLSLETLPQYDQGSVAVLFNDLITKAYHDLDDRPMLKTDRTVQLTIKLKPHEFDDHANLLSVACNIELTGKLPNKAARTHILAPSRADQALGFEPDNLRAKFANGQLTFSDAEEDPDNE